MNTHHQSQDQPRSAGSPTHQEQPENAKNGTQTPGKQDSNPEQQAIENPAAQSEIGPNIYDIGMGGPGASTSGLRTSADDEEE